MNIFSKLKGKKTYAFAAAAVLTALSTYLTGDATAIEALQLGITGVLGATVRSSIS